MLVVGCISCWCKSAVMIELLGGYPDGWVCDTCERAVRRNVSTRELRVSAGTPAAPLPTSTDVWLSALLAWSGVVVFLDRPKRGQCARLLNAPETPRVCSCRPSRLCCANRCLVCCLHSAQLRRIPSSVGGRRGQARAGNSLWNVVAPKLVHRSRMILWFI